MKISLYFLCFLLFVSASVSSQITPPDWQQKGNFSYGGRIISYAFDPQNSNTIFVGSAGGGLWKSVDGGDNWQSIAEEIPSVTIGAISIDPTNANNILVGTGEGFTGRDFLTGNGVYGSTDGGNSWSATSFAYHDSDQVKVIAFARHPSDPNKVYLAATNGIWLSTNGGTNWGQKLTGVASCVVVDETIPEGVFASIQEIPSENSSGGIFRSVNGGSTWLQLTNGLPASNQIGFTTFAIPDSFPFVVYALVSSPFPDGNLVGLFQTKNGGGLWREVPAPDIFCQQSPFDTSICQGWFDNCLVVQPNDSAVIYLGGVNIFKTSDAGASWVQSDLCQGDLILGRVHPGQHQLAIDENDFETIYAFNDGGIYKSLNGGFTWEKKNNGLNAIQLYDIDAAASDNQLMTASAAYCGTWKNGDVIQNTNWQQWESGQGFQSAIDFSNSQTFYCTDYLRGRVKTNNGGQSFQNINSGLNEKNNWFMPLEMDPSNSFTLFTATDSTIYKTTDGGNNWNPVGDISNILILAVDPNNSNIVYAADADNNFYESDDGGNNWNAVHQFNNPVTDIEPHPDLTGVVFVTFAAYDSLSQIFKSDDAGQNWINTSNNFPAEPAHCIAISDHNNHHLYVGGNSGVYFSDDAGQTWNSWNDGLPKSIVKDILYHPLDRTVRIATFGRGYWQTEAVDYTSVGEIYNAETEFIIYPNPADEWAMCSMQLADADLKVCDMLGKEIYSAHAITANFKLQISNWSSGIYFVTISNELGSTTRKLIVE